MKRMAFDIETQADMERVCLMPAPEVAIGNLKDPAKIAEKQEEAKRRQVEHAALHSHFGRVICVSIAERNGCSPDDPPHADTYIRIDMADTDRDDAERELLRWFWDRVRQAKHYVSFCGSTFDVPFLMRRSLLLGVRPARIECGRYRCAEPGCEHLDLYRLLAGDEPDPCGIKRDLRWYVNEILKEDCPYGIDFDKAELGKLFEAGRHDIIKQVCGWDCCATLRLAEAVEGVYV